MSRPPRILHLTSSYPTHDVGGAAESVSLLAEAQASAGWEVAVACLAFGHEVAETRNGVRIYRMPEWSSHRANGPVQFSPRRLRWPRLEASAYEGLIRRFDALIDAFKPDLVNTQSLRGISTRVWHMAHRRRIPVVHSLLDDDLLSATHSLVRLRQRDVSAVTALDEDLLSQHLHAGFFRHVPASRRKVIGNIAAIGAADDGDFTPAHHGPITFRYLAGLGSEAGVDTLLQAARLLPRIGWRLLIAGAAPMQIMSYRELAHGLPVEFGDFQPRDAFSDEVDLVIQPSATADALHHPALDQAHVPVITAVCGEVAEISADDAWLVPPANVLALALQMKQALMQGPPAARSCSAAGVASMEAVREYHGVYADLLGRPDLL